MREWVASAVNRTRSIDGEELQRVVREVREEDDEVFSSRSQVEHRLVQFASGLTTTDPLIDLNGFRDPSAPSTLVALHACRAEAHPGP
ncbi:hypothetical protein [Saccharothrix syringae]|uniref:Uncharacterized protein n=1 Tax=Saccharothrix syringae TaxID=103733 RepID=A0A5Q0H6R2_SACSY|nr:hypothetical protein [Saccharothrix syringae]QFZ21891.1 hypothetical protein EKG83_34815 [Saccharothrix syringae]